MKKVFASQQINEVGLLKNFLEEEEIDCMIKNEGSSMAMGGIPFTDAYPELWILNDSDFEKAHKIVDGWGKE